MWDLGLRGMWSRLLDESVGLTLQLVVVVLSHEISEIGRVAYYRELRLWCYIGYSDSPPQ